MTKFVRFAKDRFILIIPTYRRTATLNNIVNCLDDYSPVFTNVTINANQLKAAIKPAQNSHLYLSLQQRERARNLLGENAFEISASGNTRDFFQGEAILEEIIKRLKFGIIAFSLEKYHRIQREEDLLDAYRTKSLEIERYVRLFQHNARQTYHVKNHPL